MKSHDTADTLFILFLCCLSWIAAIPCGMVIGIFMQRAVLTLGYWLTWMLAWLRV